MSVVCEICRNFPYFPFLPISFPPAGSGAEPQPKSNLVHLSLKIWHLVVTKLMIFVRIIWPKNTLWTIKTFPGDNVQLWKGKQSLRNGVPAELNTELTMMCVFGRLMSQLADVNTQSTVGMFHFCDISRCCFCTSCSSLFIHYGLKCCLHTVV